MKNLLFILSVLSFIHPISAQEVLQANGGEYLTLNESQCLSTAQREAIKTMLKQNQEALKHKGILGEYYSSPVLFAWPMQKATGLSFNSYYSINNFVDQNPDAGTLDYHCDARTYDGHHGIDIDTWPFPWYLYEHNFVNVIAAQAGIIVGKSDGNDDDHCSCSGDWNAVYVQHADGSTAWYGHMKKNSLTSKTTGQAVDKGEYLGIVASSGCSTQPHLHFEIYDSSGNLIDPFDGECNYLNTSSWWESQPPNREPILNAILTHDEIPVHGCPGASESPNISNAFIPNQTIYMATYYRDQLLGDESILRIRMPNNNIWQEWAHISNGTYTKSWWYWIWVLPPGGPYGTWKFEVDYKGQTQVHEFAYNTTVSSNTIDDLNASINWDASRANITVTGIENGKITIFDALGRIFIDKTIEPNTDVSSLPTGFYFVTVKTKDGKIGVQKFIKT